MTPKLLFQRLSFYRAKRRQNRAPSAKTTATNFAFTVHTKKGIYMKFFRSLALAAALSIGALSTVSV